MEIKESVKKALFESHLQDIEIVCDVFSDLEELKSPLKRLQKISTKLKESAYTTADWTRLGVLAGILWAKLDKIIHSLQATGSGRSEQYLRDIGMKVDKLVNAINRRI